MVELKKIFISSENRGLGWESFDSPNIQPYRLPSSFYGWPARYRWKVDHKAKIILKTDVETLHMEQNYFLESFMELSFHENSF